MKTNRADKNGVAADVPARCRGPRRQALAWILAGALPIMVPLAGCGKKAAPVETEAAKEKRYPLTGEVVAVKPAENALRVRHDQIPGYMPAMTMDFTANVGDLAIAKPGMRIRAELVAGADGEFRLEKIWPADVASNAAIEAAAKTLTQDTVSKGNAAFRDVGQTAPDFSLYDQEGAVVASTRFRGKQIMLNFIFTRCPVATMCPASVARFQQSQRLAREAGVKNLELISITLEPAYDTPGVLKEYALQRVIDTSNYTLLTGPETAIKSLLAQFGVIAELKGDLLNHTLVTLLIDETGRIIYRADGSKWEADDFVQRMKKE